MRAEGGIEEAMSTIMTRSAVEFWGRRKLPKNVAYLVSDGPGGRMKEVTWDEIMDGRREKQANILSHLLAPSSTRRAARLSVQYFDQSLMGGWQCYIDGIGDSEWLRYSEDKKERLMAVLPMENQMNLPGMASFAERWSIWKENFATRYQVGVFDGRPRGAVFGWQTIGPYHRWDFTPA